VYQCTVWFAYDVRRRLSQFCFVTVNFTFKQKKERDKKLMFIYYLRSTAPALLMYGYNLSMFINRCCNYFSLLTVFF